MADWRWCFVALAVSCVSVLGQTEKVTTNLPPDTVTASTSTTTPEATTITTPKTTISTTTAKTTTETTTTTTPKTTTSPTTTTPTPKTTTTAPTPAPAPQPPSPPTAGVWNVTDAKNITCIVVQFAVQFNVSYAAGKETKIALFNLPSDSLVSNGTCNNKTEAITLSWPKQLDASERNNFTLVYKMNATSHEYYISRVTLSLVYNASVFPNASSTGNMELQMKSKVWPTSVDHSYRCKKPQSLKLTSEHEGASGNLAAEVILSDVQEEAYRTTKGHQFSVAADCAGGDISDLVPIAVGCALAGLVLVVLIAYLAARYRSMGRLGGPGGYVSM